MTRTRQIRTTASAQPVRVAAEVKPLTRQQFDEAIAVMEQLCGFLEQVETSGPKHEYASMRDAITRLELYRDWWAAPSTPSTEPAFREPSRSPAAEAQIEELKAQVRYWRGYSRRNEDRAKKAQRELDQIKTTRRQR